MEIAIRDDEEVQLELREKFIEDCDNVYSKLWNEQSSYYTT